MRIRFWATIRNPAFSITALMAPVRLRAVASGLMMEKVRSIAMCGPYKIAPREVAGLYRRSRCTASEANRQDNRGAGLRRFHLGEPSLKRLARFRSASRAYVFINRSRHCSSGLQGQHFSIAGASQRLTRGDDNVTQTF